MQRAASYARAAVFHGALKNVDPFELIALARNESDFDDRTVGPDGLDCGVTQTRITYSRYSCDQLKRSSWLAFAEAARELHAYAESCQGHQDYDRCRFNRYNSGTNYARRGPHGRYYLRISCFAEAARRHLPIEGRCRSVRSPEELAVWIQEAQDRSTPQVSSEALAQVEAPTPPRSDLKRAERLPWEATVQAVDTPTSDPPEDLIFERLRWSRERLRPRRI